MVWHFYEQNVSIQEPAIESDISFIQKKKKKFMS